MKNFAALLLATAVLSGCGTSDEVDNGDAGGSSGGGSSQADLVYGCNWLFEATAQNANFAFPEKNAVYWVAALPDTVATGDHIEIAGVSATARYFSLELYNEDGKAESDVNDAGIFGDTATPAELVPSGQPYLVTVVYSATQKASGTTLVADPTDVSTRAPAHKFLLYRLYLPTGSAAQRASLPVLTYVAAGGTRTPLAKTPDQASCNTIVANARDKVGGSSSGSSGASSSSGSSSGLGVAPAPAKKPPKMEVFKSKTGVFQNLDDHYMDVKTNTTLGTILLVRGKAPAFAGSGQTAQLRYWSVCSDESHSTKVVDCVADQDATLDADGDYNVIIDTVTPPSGYATAFNYLPWGSDAFGRPIVRQLLADASFKQSIANNQDALLPAEAMGDYYPATTYCTAEVFSANLAAGPAAVFTACQNSQGTGVVADPGN